MAKIKNDLNERDNFSNKLGFIIACVGSAVGMGNIWLFPYRVGQFGGAAFLIPYFIFVLLLGFTGVVEEIAFGRAMQSGPLGSFKKAMQKHGKNYGDIIGLIPVVGSFGIAIGYSVVVGWILRFTVLSFTGDVTKNTDSVAFFGQIAGKYGSLPWHIAALLLILIIMSFGIKDGIEKLNKILMPLFFIMFVLLGLRVAFLSGSGAGYKFLFNANWSKLLELKTWIFALGQAFFSLSLAGSGTLVYGSYLKRDVDVVNSAINIAIFDTIAALLAALVILPSVFAFSLEPTAGPPLMFIVMPEIFKQMPLGSFFSTIFFVAVLFAGITSLVNLFETPIETLQYRFKLSRFTSVSIIVILGLITGIALEDGNSLGVWMDFISINIIPLGALLAAIMFFWVCGEKFAKEQINLGRSKDSFNADFIVPLGKYLFCGLTIFVLIVGIILNGIG